MRTMIELRKNGERHVYHQTAQGQKAWTHPDEKSAQCVECIKAGRVPKKDS